jgi:hypothetical protein
MFPSPSNERKQFKKKIQQNAIGRKQRLKNKLEERGQKAARNDEMTEVKKGTN